MFGALREEAEREEARKKEEARKAEAEKKRKLEVTQRRRRGACSPPKNVLGLDEVWMKV